ncbi:MAG: FecR family protein [Agriterribacter sp.]
MERNEQDNERLWTLMARKTAKEITPEEEKELADLLQEHPYAMYTQEIIDQHWNDAYKNLQENDIDNFFAKHQKRLQEAEQERVVNEIVLSVNEDEVKTKSFPLWRYLSAAAVCALVVFTGWMWLKPSAPVPVQVVAETMEQVATPKASRSQIVLSDGTKVWLNADSKLSYPKQFDDKKREVTLEGEAYFDVVKNDAKPFYVHTKNFQIKVVGTAFNVRAYKDEPNAETSLIRGLVEIEVNKNKDHVVVLHPNEKLTIPTPSYQKAIDTTGNRKNASGEEPLEIKKTAVTSMKDEANTISETAWVDNKLAFKNTSFERIAQSLEKWFGTEIKFRNESKKHLNLSGTFEEENIDQILKAFQLTGRPFTYERDSNGVIWIQ